MIGTNPFNIKIGTKGGSNLSGVFGPQGASLGLNLQPSDVVSKIQQVLAQMPEVEKASGTVNVKVRGQKSRTVTFNYK